MIQKKNSVPSAETKDDSSTTVDVTTSAQITPNPMLAAGLSKKAKCHNCKFASKQFKVVDRNYVHCQNEDLYPAKDFESGKLTAWDTLMSWYDTCNNHELKK
jgi:hypothetical protein